MARPDPGCGSPRSPAGVEGAIWDGHDLYTVTRYDRIAPFLTTPLDAAPGQTVVYRLSDSVDVLPRDFCALSDAVNTSKATNGLDQYVAVMHEIEAGMYTPQITRQIEISLIGDTNFQAAESSDPTAAMLARLNIVEGIFSEQVGLLILATDVRLMQAGADPFTATKGSTLLEQLGAYRAATPEVRARGLAHLMTGKDLDGTTAGIAYVRTVCDVERGVSVSSRSYGTTISALIMAHELGHNFGAEHDGEAGTACAGTGGGFIMAPSVSGFATFSECSLNTMERVIAAAECVTEAQFADVTVDAGVASVTGEGGLPFTLPFVVRSTGNTAAQDAALTITLPNNAAFTIDSATSSLGSCSVSGLTATCSFGTMDIDASANVTVIARSSRGGGLLGAGARQRRQRPPHLQQQPPAAGVDPLRRGCGDRALHQRRGSAAGRAHRGLCRCELAALAAAAQRGSLAQSQPGRDLREHAGRDVHDECHIGELHDRRSSGRHHAQAHRSDHHPDGRTAVRQRQHQRAGRRRPEPTTTPAPRRGCRRSGTWS